MNQFSLFIVSNFRNNLVLSIIWLIYLCSWRLDLFWYDTPYFYYFDIDEIHPNTFEFI